MIFWLLIISVFLLSCETQTKPESAEKKAPDQTSIEKAAEKPGDSSHRSDNSEAGNCSNPYYPISDQAREYKISGSDPAEYILTQDKNEGDSFTETRKFGSGLDLKINWKCTDEGLRNAEFTNSATVSNANGKMETLESSGITLPKKWEVGKEWKTNYKVSVEVNAGSTSGGADGTINIENKIISIGDKISVPGGDFEAARIDSTTQITMSMKGRKIPVQDIIMSNWFAPEVGLIKQEVTSQFGKQTVEYVGKK